ncbi:SDR family NAD(P)-dependent oxidoreductase [Novosphingobium sp. Fuku2-ISO-50]|jgi:NAD(P)-dependent dehydrogenase (short-subunit alcohol dehydrogenase family)|uniref:SDR family NAD(P)-dependent oxidoreductase n=1 Tax=Novosphingobium sp. Fuku2-ISO-50 TaxID=1739114 RepID=UPI00076C3B92|nr:SDR family NAD(P)-dependent oxidoreductase [Novosphingobium sp. Fuku2-ISO-50]KUR78485.1 2,5-dichloro-2,5-cyclohexadiene-1,4-diol dehydrogenase [Novosphingobium sp. Fuku2-ISO-50]
MSSTENSAGARFTGKTIVVTGAASGIGRATALAFAGEGGIVYAADIDAAGLAATAAASNGEIRTVVTDVTQTEDIRALMDRAAAETGGIDVVFNNAGAGGDRAPIDEIEPAGWDRTMDLLLRSVAFGIRYAVPHMKGRASTRNGGAAIINTSSVAAVGPGYSPTAYAVAKAGVLHLSKVAAADLAKHGIRVAAVQPGFINTNIFTRALDLTGDAETSAKAAIAAMSQQAQPVARGGQASDIAEAVLFLASEAAGFVTGTSLIVDGGMTIGPRHSWDPNSPGIFEALEQFVQPPAA